MSNRELLERCLNALEWVYGGEPCDLEGTIQAVKAELSKPLQSEELSAELIAGIISCYQPHDKEHPSKCLPIAKNIMESVVTPLISELKSKLTEAGKDAMNEEKAKAILGEDVRENGLYCLGRYLSYTNGELEACLDADFKADELEAIAFMMRLSISNNTKEQG